MFFSSSSRLRFLVQPTHNFFLCVCKASLSRRGAQRIFIFIYIIHLPFWDHKYIPTAEVDLFFNTKPKDSARALSSISFRSPFQSSVLWVCVLSVNGLSSSAFPALLKGRLWLVGFSCQVHKRVCLLAGLDLLPGFWRTCVGKMYVVYITGFAVFILLIFILR